MEVCEEEFEGDGSMARRVQLDLHDSTCFRRSFDERDLEAR